MDFTIPLGSAKPSINRAFAMGCSRWATLGRAKWATLGRYLPPLRPRINGIPDAASVRLVAVRV